MFPREADEAGIVGRAEVVEEGNAIKKQEPISGELQSCEGHCESEDKELKLNVMKQQEPVEGLIGMGGVGEGVIW